MSTYTFHVLYQRSTPQAVITLVVLLSASACVFFWFNRKPALIPVLLPSDDGSNSNNNTTNDAAPEPPATTKETAPEPTTPTTPAVVPPAPKKSKSTKADKKGDKGKKRLSKQQLQDAAPAPKVRTLAHRRPSRRPDDSTVVPVSSTDDQQEQEQEEDQPHALESPLKAVDEPAPPSDQQSHPNSQSNSPPRPASPSPSESTTATTAATVQSSTLILTPPPVVSPPLTSVPVEHENEKEDGERPIVSDSAQSEHEHEGWIRVADDTPTLERPQPEPPTPLLVVPPPKTIPIDITTPTSPQNDTFQSIITSPTSNIPPPDDGETPSDQQNQNPSAIITPATPDKPVHPPPSPIPRSPSSSSQHPRSSTPSDYARSPRSRQPSSGGVGLGIPSTSTTPSPAPTSQPRSISRSSPASSPLRTGQALPPRHRRHQPGQPPQQIPPPLLQPLQPYAHFGGRPVTPGVRSPTSPVVPFIAAGPPPPGWMPGPGPGYPHPHSPQPMSPQGFMRHYPPPPGFLPPGPISPGYLPYMQPPNPNLNPNMRAMAVSQVGSDQNDKPKSSEGEEKDEDYVVEFPTLNPTPGKPETAEAGPSESQLVERPQPPPPGWMSPGFAPYPPPEMVGYPAQPWSPQASAFFHPRPYPTHPGASTPSASSASSSPAWTHMGLPPMPPNGRTVGEAGASGQDKQQQPFAPEEDLRRQSLANSLANSKPGTSTPSASGSTTSSPRTNLTQLPGPPNPPHMMIRPGPPIMPTGYFPPLPQQPPWMVGAQGAQNSSRSGTPSGERSRSSSPFVGGGRATPPVMMYPGAGYFGGPPPPMPPHPGYAYGPPPPQMMMMQPPPGPPYVNGRYGSPLQARTRTNTDGTSSVGAEVADEGERAPTSESLEGIAVEGTVSSQPGSEVKDGEGNEEPPATAQTA